MRYMDVSELCGDLFGSGARAAMAGNLTPGMLQLIMLKSYDRGVGKNGHEFGH